jgi:cinnamoyl-CoA reductase
LFCFCRCKDQVNPLKKGYKFTNQPLKDLGVKFTPVHGYLYEAVKSLQDKGFLPKTSGAKVITLKKENTP